MDDRMQADETIMVSQPVRQTIAVFPTYEEAQSAVDHLSDEKFPVERTAIVAEGLQFVEQVTGRLGWGKAALNGALAGGATGLLIGFIFGLFSLIQPVASALTLAINGLLIGALIGALIGLAFYALSGGARDFTSVSGIQADRYNVMADAEVADEAIRLLKGMDPSIGPREVGA
jgi:uncharacterized protein YcfJ